MHISKYSASCFLLVIMAMVFASEVTGEKEIIFPELAALAVGCFLTPRLVWKTSYLKIISSISLCALLGLGIVCFLPVPLWSQFLLAFALGQLIFFLSKTTFAPMISAISLPVLIQTKSPVYVLSAFLLTFLVILLSLFLEKKGKKAENKYQPICMRRGDFFSVFFFRTMIVGLLAFFCIDRDLRFLVAPPLLVAFCELTGKNSPAIERWVKVILLVSCCALFGAACRFFFSMTLNLPLTLAALISGLAVLALVRLFDFPFPPACAMALLAMLIPEEAVLPYPAEVFAGITALTSASLLWKKFSAYRK